MNKKKTLKFIHNSTIKMQYYHKKNEIAISNITDLSIILSRN